MQLLTSFFHIIIKFLSHRFFHVWVSKHRSKTKLIKTVAVDEQTCVRLFLADLAWPVASRGYECEHSPVTVK